MQAEFIMKEVEWPLFYELVDIIGDSSPFVNDETPDLDDFMYQLWWNKKYEFNN